MFLSAAGPTTGAPLVLGPAVSASTPFVGPRAVPTVTSFTLINADTDLPIAGFDPIPAGATLDLSKLPTDRLNVRANVGAGTAAVRFGYDANANYNHETVAPFALAGDAGADYAAWTPAAGSHTIKGTPYASSASGGAAGAVKSLSIKVVAGTTPTPPKTPAATWSAVGTTGLKASWAAVGGDVSNYRVAYAPGDYVPGVAGQWRQLDVSAATTSVSIAGLRPFTQYTLRVSALDAAGNASPADQDLAWTGKPAGLQRYLYSFHLPKDVLGYRNEQRRIEVYDVSDGHKWVKNIPLPGGIYNVRGVAASVETNRLYFTYFKTAVNSFQPGGLVAMNLTTGAVVYKRDYPKTELASVDRFDITPDGKTLYIPAGEHGAERYWAIVDAATGNITGRINHTTAPHNTIVSLDGTRVFLEGQEKDIPSQPADVLHTVGVVDTATNKVIQKVGKFYNAIRPFTVNGKASLIFGTTNNMIGFQVGDVATGKILYTAKPPSAYSQPTPSEQSIYSHGIALTPDEKEIWVVDSKRPGFHVFDVSGVPSKAPVWKQFVAVRRRGKDLAGNVVPEAGNDVTGAPAWVATSWDGKYMYAEGGEVFDVATHRAVAQLRAKEVDASGNATDSPYWSHSRFLLEVQFDAGKPLHVTKQFGIGKVR